MPTLDGSLTVTVYDLCVYTPHPPSATIYVSGVGSLQLYVKEKVGTFQNKLDLCVYVPPTATIYVSGVGSVQLYVKEKVGTFQNALHFTSYVGTHQIYQF